MTYIPPPGEPSVGGASSDAALKVDVISLVGRGEECVLC